MYYQQPPPQYPPPQYGPRYGGCLKLVLYLISFLVPFVGIVIGIIFMSRGDPESKSVGRACMIISIAVIVISWFRIVDTVKRKIGRGVHTKSTCVRR